MPVDRACILGVGLLGGSLGLALKQRAVAKEVVGASRTPATLEAALELGALDRAEPNFEAAVHEADLVVICTPVLTVPTLLARIAPHLPEAAVVTDVGSTKRAIVDAVTSAHPAVRFVGGHPLAGSEKTGVKFARADLFEGRTYFLTPVESTDPAALRLVQSVARDIGAKPVILSPEEHDHLLALTSHMPHLLASLGVTLAQKRSPCPVALGPAVGPGFLDTTRVAAGGSEMWTDILLTNADNLDQLLGELAAEIEALRALLRPEEQSRLRDWLERAAQFRAALGHHGNA